MEWLSRQFNSRLDDALDSGPFDFIILGAGFFGAYAACQLMEQSYPKRPRILLLDQGDFSLQHHYTTYPYLNRSDLAAISGQWQGSRIYFETRDQWREERGHRLFNVIGGDSHFWDLSVPRPSLDDMSMWPGGMVETLEDNLISVEQQLGVRSKPAYWRGGLQERLVERVSTITSQWDSVQYVSNAPMAIQTTSPQSGQLARGPFSPLSDLLEHLAEDGRHNIHLVSRCKVKKLHMIGKYVTQLKVMDDSRNQVRMVDVPPRTQVISTLGCRASTGLFLNSFEPFHRSYRYIGRQLATHMRSVFHLQVRKELLQLPLEESRNSAGIIVQGKDYLFQLFAAPGRQVSGQAGLHRPSSLQTTESDSKWVTLTLLSHTVLPGSRGCLKPEAENNLAASMDLCAHYRLGREDLERWQGSDRLAAKLLNTLVGNKRPEGSVLWRQGDSWVPEAPKTTAQIRLPLGSSVHECASLPMSENSNEGILDPWGQCHAVYNLSCLDAAAIPWMGAASPVLPTLAWGRMAVGQLVHQWQAAPDYRPAAINGRISH